MEMQATEFRNQQQDEEDTAFQSNTDFSLPPVDRGKDAWGVLAGAFIVEALVWGFPFSYGIFQEYFTNLPQFEGQESQIPIVGTVASGILYLASPVCLMLCRQFPHRRRQAVVVGFAIISLALVSASFAQTVWHLILTQGVLFAIGGSLAYYPCLLFIDEWFVRRKGLAYGLCWGATGLSGLVTPFVSSWLLEHYSFRTTLRVWTIVNLALILPVIPFLKPRLPTSMVVRVHRPKLGFAIKPRFLIYQTGSIIESLGFFLPALYLPSYARSLGFSSGVATASVSVLNVGAFLGCISVGYLVDRWNISNCILFSTVGATLACTFLWGFSNSAALVIIFALLYGYFAGSFSTTWPGIAQEILRGDPTAETGSIYCFLVAGRGIGSVLTGPLSEALLHVPRITKDFTFGYGSGYGTLIVFAASTALFGGLGPLFRRVGFI